MEDQESLESGTLVSQLSESVQDDVDHLLTDGVVASGVVVGGVFLSGHQLFRVEQLSVGSSSDLVDDCGFQVDEDSSGDVFAGTGLTEEGVERIITASDGLVAGHLAIGLDSVLEAVQLPTGITDLDTGLANMDRDTFTHFELSVFWGVSF